MTPCGPSWHRPWATAANGQEIAPSLEDLELWHHSSTTWVRFLWSIAFCFWQIVWTRKFGRPWHPFDLRRSCKQVLVFGESVAVTPLFSGQSVAFLKYKINCLFIGKLYVLVPMASIYSPFGYEEVM